MMPDEKDAIIADLREKLDKDAIIADLSEQLAAAKAAGRKLVERNITLEKTNTVRNCMATDVPALLPWMTDPKPLIALVPVEVRFDQWFQFGERGPKFVFFFESEKAATHFILFHHYNYCTGRDIDTVHFADTVLDDDGILMGLEAKTDFTKDVLGQHWLIHTTRQAGDLIFTLAKKEFVANHRSSACPETIVWNAPRLRQELTRKEPHPDRIAGFWSGTTYVPTKTGSVVEGIEALDYIVARKYGNFNN